MAKKKENMSRGMIIYGIILALILIGTITYTYLFTSSYYMDKLSLKLDIGTFLFPLAAYIAYLLIYFKYLKNLNVRLFNPYFILALILIGFIVSFSLNVLSSTYPSEFNKDGEKNLNLWIMNEEGRINYQENIENSTFDCRSNYNDVMVYGDTIICTYKLNYKKNNNLTFSRITVLDIHNASNPITLWNKNSIETNDRQIFNNNFEEVHLINFEVKPFSFGKYRFEFNFQEKNNSNNGKNLVYREWEPQQFTEDSNNGRKDQKTYIIISILALSIFAVFQGIVALRDLIEGNKKELDYKNIIEENVRMKFENEDSKIKINQFKQQIKELKTKKRK